MTTSSTGKEHPHVHFPDEDIKRVEGKEHKDYPTSKTHLPDPPHVHFPPQDIARVERNHKEYPKTPLPKKTHVHFDQEDVARVEGKEHKDYPKTLFSESHDEPHVHFKAEDVARVEGKEHKDYPKTLLPEKQHVHFKEEDLKRKENKAHVDFPKTRMAAHKKQRAIKPGSVKISKEDFFTHLKIMGFLGVLFSFGVWYSSGDPWEEVNKPKPKSLQQLYQEDIQRQLQILEPELPTYGNIQLPPEGINSNGCDLFLTDSAIPQSGFGVFSTRAFEGGDVIFGQSHVLEVQGLDVPIHAMLLKQHPHFGNVQSTKSGIVAKRNIEVGEELFIDLNDMDQQFASIYFGVLHPLDPLNEDYLKADNIVKDIMEAIPYSTVYEGPKKKNYKQRSDRKKNPKQIPSVDAGRLFAVVKDALKEYNSKLENLLPETTVLANSIIEKEGTAHFISNHRSVEWITKNGICLGGLSSQSSCPTKQAMMEHDGGDGAFTTRSVAVGEVIATAPLYAMPEEVAPVDGNCIPAPVTGVFLCPLSFASSIQKGGSCNDKAKECSKKFANANYQWSQYNTANQSRNELSAHELLMNPMTGWTIDIIATRNIARNEEVFVDFSI